MKKNYILKIALIILTISMLLYPSTTYEASVDGLLLWFNIVFPSLLPFFILVDLLIALNILTNFSKIFEPAMKSVFHLPGIASFPLVMSFFSGYPMGAKIVSDLVSSKRLSISEGQKTLSLASTSGPLFIMGAVATGMLAAPQYAIFLLIVHYLSALSMGVLINTKHSSTSQLIGSSVSYETPKGLLSTAISNSIASLLSICGYIVFFSVISALLLKTGMLDIFNSSIVTPIGVGFLEITNGIKYLSISSLSLNSKLIAASFLLAFGGLSINMQVNSFLTKTKLNFNLYLMRKVLQGIIASIYCFIGLKIFDTLPVFNIEIPVATINWRQLVFLHWAWAFIVFLAVFMIAQKKS